jgi:hypothetical protein
MIRVGAPASRESSRRFVSRKYARWFSAKVISIPSTLSRRRITIAPALLISTSRRGHL